MIDANDITNFNRTDNELEEFILFSIAVAGKTASTTAERLERLLWAFGYPTTRGISPFGVISQILFMESRVPDKVQLSTCLKQYGFGCYNQRARSFRELLQANLNLRTCTIDDLESIYGIGRKTSRFFLLHSRPDVRVAALDTHILKFMKDNKIVKNVPKQTPSSRKQYLELEKAYLDYVGNVNLAEMDLNIWRQYTNK